MTYSAKHQQGLTFISIVFILAILGFFVLLTLKIAPIYMNHSKVVNALAALEAMDGLETMSKREIRKSLDKRFGMNYVEKIEPDDITIVKKGNYVKVDIEYERVENVVGNLSILADFHEFVEAGDKL